MKAHLVFAHPNLNAYNGQLRDVAIQTLKSFGWSVSVSDLYQMKFKASADEDDFTTLHDPDYFEVQCILRSACFPADLCLAERWIRDCMKISYS